MHSKAELRKSMLQKRDSLSEAEIKEKSTKIIQSLTQLPEFKSARRICIYVSTKNEVHTHDLIQQLTKSNVLVPFLADGRIQASIIKEWSDLIPGAYGILEPKQPKPATADLFIIPGAVFDLTGHRIGYGKGYYDHLLSQNPALKIGIAFDFQTIEQIPAENHDIPVNIIITEKRIIHT
jgi:5-formyltetrahydrofolate cyclo-ligase